MLPLSRITATLSFLLFISMCGSAAVAQEYDPNTSITPLRLSYAEGEVSFWRLGSPDWVSAQLNTPLAISDALYVGRDGDLELQMGSRAFIRADDNTQFSLVNQTPDFIQFKVVAGRVSFDLRALSAGYSVEVDTPNAVFTIDHVGYYRVDVDGDVHFTTRRGGMAMMVPAGGKAMSIHPSEEIVVWGDAVAQAETYAAPELDQWDRWNYDRTDGLIDTVSERYLPYGVAGVSDLDHYGNWRVVPEYGPVWVPDAVPYGWAPYSTGRWGWDPYYQWTWIDDAPWGWAPFHYGRWVYLSGYWAWTPGPVTRHPVYAPALVAFFDVDSTMAAGISSSGVGWVALSWGEPVTPWWGRPGFVGRPWWGGWRGPRVVDNVYHNIRVNNSVVATTHEHFGKGRVHDAPVHVMRPQELKHVRGALPVKPGPTSLAGGAPVGIRPPESMLSRPVVGTRPPREFNLPWRDKTLKPEAKAVPEQRYVPIPKRPPNDLPRPEFGTQTGEERPRPALPPRFDERRRATEPAIAGGVTRERAETSQAAPKVSRTPSTDQAAPMVVPTPLPDQTAPKAFPVPSHDQAAPKAFQAPSHDQAAPRVVPTPSPDQTAPKVSRTPSPEAPQQRLMHEIITPRAVQERGRLTPEPRRIEAAPAAPRAAPAETRQQERPELPGKPANRVYNNKNKDQEKDGDKKKNEQQRSHQKPE